MKETGAQELRFEGDGSIPNNPKLPLLLYPQALPEDEQDASRCRDWFVKLDPK